MTKVIDKPKVEETINEPPPIILKNWSWYYGRHLVGNAYGHPNFPDGTLVCTSEVQEINEAIGIARTRNTLYILRDRAK